MYMNLDNNSPIITAFSRLGEEDVDPLSLQSEMEEFVCKCYSKTTNCKDVSSLRWELFRDHNKEGDQLPPTLDAFTPHLQRSHLGYAQIAKGYTSSHPSIPPLVESGWEETTTGTISATTCLSDPAPQEVLALTKCACKKECSTRCSCIKNGLQCTGLCKCADCPNMSSRYTSESNEEGDEDELGI